MKSPKSTFIFLALLSAFLLLLQISNAVHLKQFESDDFLHEQHLPDEHQIKFYVVLSYNNPAAMHDELMEISDPVSPRYGQHLSVDELKRKYSQSSESVSEVLDYFRGKITFFLSGVFISRLILHSFFKIWTTLLRQWS